MSSPSILAFSTTAANNDTGVTGVNFAENQAPSTLNDSARALMARLAYWRDWQAGNVTQGGSSNAYTFTSGETLTAYSNGLRIAWRPNHTATGAVTLDVDGIGAKKVYRPDGTQATAGDVLTATIVDLVYLSSLDSGSGGFQMVGSARYASTGLYVSATDKLIGRSSSGAGLSEEITCTAAGRAILDDADASAQRTTLGLGTAAVMTGPSGTIVGTSDTQTLTNKTLSSPTFSGTIAGNVSASGAWVFTGIANYIGTTGDAVGHALYLRADAGTTNDLGFNSGTSIRWTLRRSSTAESGSNAGSDFQIIARTDAGGTVGTALQIIRATMAIALGGALTVGGALIAAAATTSAPSLRIPSGTAPSSPTTGDLWYDGTNLKFRDGGTTRTISWT